jgi:hypothetical protein
MFLFFCFLCVWRAARVGRKFISGAGMRAVGMNITGFQTSKLYSGMRSTGAQFDEPWEPRAAAFWRPTSHWW